MSIEVDVTKTGQNLLFGKCFLCEWKTSMVVSEITVAAKSLDYFF